TLALIVSLEALPFLSFLTVAVASARSFLSLLRSVDSSSLTVPRAIALVGFTVTVKVAPAPGATVLGPPTVSLAGLWAADAVPALASTIPSATTVARACARVDIEMRNYSGATAPHTRRTFRLTNRVRTGLPAPPVRR